MNSLFGQFLGRRMADWPARAASESPCLRRLAAAGLVALAATGCSDPDTVQVKLQALSLPHESAIYQQIEAQIAGPTDGLEFKWYAVSGECEPQASDKPKTIFKFSEGVRQDRVSVEVWRNKKRVAQGELKVKFDEEIARREPARAAEARIKITNIPPSEIGGEHTHADITGMISGEVPPGCAVAIYVRAYGRWYVQPEAGSLHKINHDKTWGTWTHTGTRYAALLVRPGYEPLKELDMLPQTSGAVLAEDIVDGLSADPPSNTASSSHPPAP